MSFVLLFWGLYSLIPLPRMVVGELGEINILVEALIVPPGKKISTLTKFRFCLNDVCLKHLPKNTNLVECTGLNICLIVVSWIKKSCSVSCPLAFQLH